MDWNRRANDGATDDVADWAYPPNGGRLKMVLAGLLLPLWVGYRAWVAWTTETAIWFGNRSSDMEVKGDTAKAIAVCYLAAALFAHFRWFWGLWPCYRLFEIGIVLAMILGLGGCGSAWYFAFR